MRLAGQVSQSVQAKQAGVRRPVQADCTIIFFDLFLVKFTQPPCFSKIVWFKSDYIFNEVYVSFLQQTLLRCGSSRYSGRVKNYRKFYYWPFNFENVSPSYGITGCFDFFYPVATVFGLNFVLLLKW